MTSAKIVQKSTNNSHNGSTKKLNGPAVIAALSAEETEANTL